MKAIIIGASSGIGEALAKEMSNQGWELGLTARREEKLKALSDALPGKVWYKRMDVSDPQAARKILAELVEEMGGLDQIILNAGVGDPKDSWENEAKVISINATGFAALAHWAFEYFAERKHGHIIGISSIAGMVGLREGVVYSASKAFVINYMEGLRHRSKYNKLGVTVTDIRPGYVTTAINEWNENKFWEATPEKAARQIVASIRRKSNVAFVSRRWRLIGWVFRLIPKWIQYKL